MKDPQQPKTRIDTGVAGDASTGDTIFEGGQKINSNFDEVYNAFADWRLFDAGNQGVGLQRIHPVGYYQKYPINYYTSGPVEMGTMHDINTEDNPVSAVLPNGRQGERIVFRDSSNTWSNNPLIVTPQAGESINGSGESVSFYNADSIVEFTCVSDSIGSVDWTYIIRPIKGDFSVPVNRTQQVSSATPQTINLFDTSLYNGVKFMVYASDEDGLNKQVSEMLMMIDNELGAVTDEYSIITKGDKPCNVTYQISGNNVTATITSNFPSIRFVIKSIETIKVTT